MPASSARGQVAAGGSGAAPCRASPCSVPNTGPDEPPIVDMQVMPIVLQRVVQRLACELVEPGLDGERAAAHVEAVVAVADRLVERGQLLDMVDQRLRSRLG